MELKLSGRIIGVKCQIDTFNYFYGVTILELVLRQNDNFSRTLQKPPTTACQGKEVADLTLVMLISLRSDEMLDLIWEKVLKDANSLQLAEKPRPHKPKRPVKILSGN